MLRDARSHRRVPKVTRIIPAMPTLFALILALILAGNAQADPFVMTFSELSTGVWAGIRENSPRLPVTGNTVFVVGENGVIVFDGGSVPLVSERVIAKIREVTDLPVTHVAISHWHGDHNLGIYLFAEEFPRVQFIGHPFTRAAMLGSNMDYARKPDRVEGYLPSIKTMVEDGVDEEGNPVSETTRQWFAEFLEDADLVDTEYRRARITPPDLTFTDKLVIYSGERRVEFLYLGDGNTAGDIVMWLPEERIVASGDMVVAPTPYGFNVPPRKWAQTLRGLNNLGYRTLVPGHGDVQNDQAYVDLLIETAESIADQRDALVEAGIDPKDGAGQLDFSAFESRYTGGDLLNAERFAEWFVGPFGEAAFKALTGEPMVVVEPSKVGDPNQQQQGAD